MRPALEDVDAIWAGPGADARGKQDGLTRSRPLDDMHALPEVLLRVRRVGGEYLPRSGAGCEAKPVRPQFLTKDRHVAGAPVEEALRELFRVEEAWVNSFEAAASFQQDGVSEPGLSI